MKGNGIRIRLARRATRDAIRLVAAAADRAHLGSARMHLLASIEGHLREAKRLLREAR